MAHHNPLPRPTVEVLGQTLLREIEVALHVHGIGHYPKRQRQEDEGHACAHDDVLHAAAGGEESEREREREQVNVV